MPSAPIECKSPEKVNPQQNDFLIWQCEEGAYIERWLDNANSHGKELGKVDLDRTMNIADS